MRNDGCVNEAWQQVLRIEALEIENAQLREIVEAVTAERNTIQVESARAGVYWQSRALKAEQELADWLSRNTSHSPPLAARIRELEAQNAQL